MQHRVSLLTILALIIAAAGCSLARGTVAQPDVAVVEATIAPEKSILATLAESTAQPIAIPPLAPTPTEGTPLVAIPSGDISTLTISLVPVVSGLVQPVALVHAGDGSERLFVVEKTGRVRIIANDQLLPTPFLDISGRVGSSSREQGLLGIAFHPDYMNNGFFFANYTNVQGDTVVSRFRVTDDPGLADPTSEEIVLEVVQPAGNHNGGNLAFGPDNYLWIGLGDGGRSGDAFGNGQNTRTLLGAMLRINVDQLPYSIPPDNPFANDTDNLGEIWAYGLRNPWRYSFDRTTGDLYLADVGQNTYEEVNVAPADASGLNFGWPIMEGQHCYNAANCDNTGLVLPVAEYEHSLGCSISGGYVYRGEQFSQMEGVYLFGDYCTASIWGMLPNGESWQVSQVGQATGVSLSSFGEGEDGELYLLDMAGGVVYHITAQ